MTAESPAATVYLMHGFPAAGKSTFARQLAADTGALRLNADEYCEAHFTAADLSRAWDECFGRAVDALWHETAQLTAGGRSVILDFGFWTRASRDDARARIAAMGAVCVHYYLDTPEEILRTRMGARQGDIAARNLANFKSLRTQFEPPAADEIAVVIRPPGI